MEDKFQQYYLEHQQNKKITLEQGIGEQYKKRVSNSICQLMYLMQNRRSQRVFTHEPLNNLEIDYILEAVRVAPSSCNRQAIYLVDGNKFLLSQILVGGKEWILNANKVYLVMASREAYKNPAEVNYMPYLDAGFVGQNVLLMAETLGIGSCFVNPNIREYDLDTFVATYGEDYFCGALVLGNYDKKAHMPRKRGKEDILK